VILIDIAMKYNCLSIVIDVVTFGSPAGVAWDSEASKDVKVDWVILEVLGGSCIDTLSILHRNDEALTEMHKGFVDA
jgi:hypothetical protein